MHSTVRFIVDQYITIDTDQTTNMDDSCPPFVYGLVYEILLYHMKTTVHIELISCSIHAVLLMPEYFMIPALLVFSEGFGEARFMQCLVIRTSYQFFY